MKRLAFFIFLVGGFCCGSADAQERVYVSTDKDVYLSGENLWFSVYCMDASTGGYSNLSDVAYLQVALIEGRGCGVFPVPLDFATGNYSIVSYTKAYGGDCANEFNGKIISVFNTISAKRVKGGVEVGEMLQGGGKLHRSGNVSIEVGRLSKGSFPVKIKNNGAGLMQLSVSVYHADSLSELAGSYNGVSLLERTGDFDRTDEVDYAGEVVKVKVTSANGSSCLGKYVYMSAIGNTDDVYVSKVDNNGTVTFYTNSIMGQRDLVFEVLDDSRSVAQGTTAKDTAQRYDIEILERSFRREVVEIPKLRISRDMDKALRERGRRMQISKMFEADTLLDMCKRKDNSFVGDTEPLVYNLDDYTRFSNLEEVLREYVKFARVKDQNSKAELKVLWGAKGRCLALLDGVPVSDHSKILDLDQQHVRQIVVYPKRYMLNNFIYDVVVNFVTYRGDIGGISLAKNVSVVGYNGVSWPLAFFGGKVAGNDAYPNFLSTLYWNPLVDVPSDEEFEFHCFMPEYKGKFRVVVEGLLEGGKEVYAVEEFEYR